MSRDNEHRLVSDFEIEQESCGASTGPRKLNINIFLIAKRIIVWLIKVKLFFVF